MRREGAPKGVARGSSPMGRTPDVALYLMKVGFEIDLRKPVCGAWCRSGTLGVVCRGVPDRHGREGDQRSGLFATFGMSALGGSRCPDRRYWS
jgi:hypothetical protein